MSMTTQEAIEVFERVQIHSDMGSITMDACECALAALREKEARERPEALSHNEIYAYKKCPLWLEYPIGEAARWVIVSKHFGEHATMDEDTFVFTGHAKEYYLGQSDYGKTWLAYAHRPGEAEGKCLRRTDIGINIGTIHTNA